METNPANAIVPPKAAKATRATLSTKHADLLEQANMVQLTWLKHADYTLLWTSCSEFGTLLNVASTTFSSKLSNSGERKKITSKLKVLDKEIDKGVSTLKAYLAAKHKSESAGRPYYGKFGIVWKNKSFRLSNERSERLEGLKQIKSAIVSEGFGDMELGLSYWTGIYNSYNSLYDEANAIDSQVTDSIGDKNTQAKNIRKVLNSLIYLIKAQNPDTFESELRSWGFRKDRF